MEPPPGVDPDQHYVLAQRRLGLDPERDRAGAVTLAEALAAAPGRLLDPAALRRQLQGRPVLVMGPTRGGLKGVLAAPPRTPLVVAGSALDLAYRNDLHPRVVVTDLDGAREAHLGFADRRVPLAVHGHGDNRDRVQDLVPRLDGPLLGTTQVPVEDPPVPLHRVGGFTDGDRACFLAAALGASELWLVGWDLERPVAGGEAKRAKLDLARTLLADLPVPVCWGGPGDRD